MAKSLLFESLKKTYKGKEEGKNPNIHSHMQLYYWKASKDSTK
jgi:hypothetical protein